MDGLSTTIADDETFAPDEDDFVMMVALLSLIFCCASEIDCANKWAEQCGFIFQSLLHSSRKLVLQM